MPSVDSNRTETQKLGVPDIFAHAYICCIFKLSTLLFDLISWSCVFCENFKTLFISRVYPLSDSLCFILYCICLLILLVYVLCISCWKESIDEVHTEERLTITSSQTVLMSPFSITAGMDMSRVLSILLSLLKSINAVIDSHLKICCTTLIYYPNYFFSNV